MQKHQNEPAAHTTVMQKYLPRQIHLTLFFVFLHALFFIDAANSQTPASSGLTVTDSYKGVTITLPDNSWTIENTPDDIKIRHNHDAGVTIKFTIYPTTVGLTSSEFMSSMVSVSANKPSVKIFASNIPSPLPGAGDALAMSIQDTSTNTYERAFIFATSRGIGFLVFTADVGLSGTYKQKFSQILKTMVISPPAPGRLGVKDHVKKYEFWAPNEKWAVYYGNTQYKRTALVLNDVSGKAKAMVYLFNTTHNKTDLEKAFGEHKQEVAHRYPSAPVVNDRQSLILSGKIPALAYTYKDVNKQEVIRDTVFNHGGLSWEFNFYVHDPDFQSLKPELKWIADNLVIH